MNADQFMALSMNEKLKNVNKMLEKETKDHLKNVSEKLGISYSALAKIMRDSGNYQYNQTSKRYDRLMSLEEYEEFRQSTMYDNGITNEGLKFIEVHLDDLKELLWIHQNQLTLDPEIYDPSSKTINKSFQVNADVFKGFSELCSTQFPHLRQKDLLSQCLLDFTKKYENNRIR